jgi:valyl-tRNA synthetase
VYPTDSQRDLAVEANITLFQNMITEIRQNRAVNKIDRNQILNVEIHAEADHAFINSHIAEIEKLGNVKVTLARGTYALKLNIPVDRARLEKENEGLEKQIANLDRQLGDENFLSKAPEKITAGMREKKAGYEAQLAKNRAALAGS